MNELEGPQECWWVELNNDLLSCPLRCILLYKRKYKNWILLLVGSGKNKQTFKPGQVIEETALYPERDDTDSQETWIPGLIWIQDNCAYLELHFSTSQEKQWQCYLQHCYKDPDRCTYMTGKYQTPPKSIFSLANQFIFLQEKEPT